MLKQNSKLRLSVSTVVLAIVTMLIVLITPLAANTAVSAAGTYCWGQAGSCPVFATPDPNTLFFSLNNNAPVGMICWTNTVWYSVNYSSPRWFKVNNPIIGIQWMHSSEVYNQTTVPHC